MLYLENNDIDFQNVGKNLKRSIERNLKVRTLYIQTA